MAKKVVKRILNFSGLEISRFKASSDHYEKLFIKYKTYSMVPEQMFKLNLELCEQYNNVDGDYVECGVWRGGMSAAISEVLDKKKTFHLFDSFEGLPPAKEIDGKEALQWQADKNSVNYFDNCAAEKSFAVEAMKLAKHERYKLYEGWFNETLPRYSGNPISILRLDGDWYDSIIECLEKLFPYVSSGGIVLLDDYYTWDGCTKAVHDYLARIQSPSRIHQFNNQLAYILKK
jgi:O-methyltransferase